jgi:hypothetical protein
MARAPWPGRSGPFSLLLFLPFASACGLPIATGHGPVPVSRDVGVVGLGVGSAFVGAYEDSEELTDMAILGGIMTMRTGLSPRADAGLSFGLINGLSMDAGYALLSGPVHVSVNATVSLGLLGAGVHPALLVGTERVYAGAKLVYISLPTEDVSAFPSSVFFIGGSVGNRLRLVPEVMHMRDHDGTGDTWWLVGLKLEVRRRLPDGTVSSHAQ